MQLAVAIALQQYALHQLPPHSGIVGATAHVGPPLEGIASRKYLAGRLPNTPQNMLRWIRDPKSVSIATLMPNLEVTEAHALDIVLIWLLSISACADRADQGRAILTRAERAAPRCSASNAALSSDPRRHGRARPGRTAAG